MPWPQALTPEMRIRYQLRDIRRALSLKEFLANIRYGKIRTVPCPIPSSYLRVLAIASANLHWYLDYGKRNAAAIFETLAQCGVDHTGFGTILDFGCGAGRIIRHVPSWVGSDLWGADYNRSAISWCKRNLAFAEFIHNGSLPPLPFRDHFFDFVYSMSVFTHLTEEAERLWIRELNRVIRPGGCFMLTLRGKRYIGKLNDHEQGAFNMGKIVVRNPDETGKNQCDSYHPVQHITQAYLSQFDLIAHIESPRAFVPHALESDPGQDVLLLKRRGAK